MISRGPSGRVSRPSFPFLWLRDLGAVLGIARLFREPPRTNARECECFANYDFFRIARDRAMVGFCQDVSSLVRSGSRVLGNIPPGVWQEKYHKHGRTSVGGSVNL